MFFLALLLGSLVPGVADSLSYAPPVLTVSGSDRVVPSEPIADLPVGETLGDPVPGGTPTPQSTRIDSLVFEIHGALEGSKTLTAGDSMVYVWADWLRDHVLHNRTTTGTIERRLLFQAGSSLDSIRLAETERTLRLERFLADARVRVSRGEDGRNTAVVETWDRWSTSIPTGFNRSGGELQWLLGASEANLLGSGRKVAGFYQSNVLRSSWNVTFLDNAFVHQGHSLAASLSEASDGRTWSVHVGRPLINRFQDWAWMLEYDDATFNRVVWEDATVWQELRRNHPAIRATDWSGGASGDGIGRLDASSIQDYQDFGALGTYGGTSTRKVRLWVQRVWGSDLRFATGPLLESQFDSAGILLVSSHLPASLLQEIRQSPRWAALRDGSPEIDDRRLGWQFLLRQDRWIRRANFNNLKWSEDIPVGWSLEGNVAQAVISRGEDRNGTWLALGGRWTGLPGDTYLSSSAGWVGRTGGESPYPDRQAFSWKTEARRLASPSLQGIVTASGDIVANAPITSRLALGEDGGLPGFPAHSFVGTTRNLLGTEVRWTPPLEALTIAPALAGFAAAGRVGDKIRPLGSGEWHAGAGFGFRFGLTRSISSVVNHLSFARPLGPEGGDWNELDGWMISFGSKTSL